MKKLTTLAVSATLLVVSQTAIISNAQAFSFGSFNFSDGWGDSWGDGWGDGWGTGSRYYNPRWDRYPPPGYTGNRWNRAYPRDREYSRSGFSWGNRNRPRWGAPPPARWGNPPYWRNAPGYYPPAGNFQAAPANETLDKAPPK